jgi:hypothetical protein
VVMPPTGMRVGALSSVRERGCFLSNESEATRLALWLQAPGGAAAVCQVFLARGAFGKPKVERER